MSRPVQSAITRYQFKEGLPVEFELISLADLYQQNKTVLTSPHRASFYHVLWYKKGGFDHMVDFQPVRIEDNMLLFLSQDIVHAYTDNAAIHGKGILFTDTFFGSSETDVRMLKETILFNDLFGISTVHIPKGATAFDAIFELMEKEAGNTPDQYQARILRNLLHNFLLLAERERRTQDFKEIRKGPDLDYVLLFRDLLETQYRTHKQVSYYATELSVTEKRLNQATSKILGKTSKQMIDERIMLEAKRLLVHSADTIKEIAYQLGFMEPTNFIKYFRKHSQYTPVEFREKLTTSKTGT
ncbi:helix-turn-helix domain-containing protein [Chitinophaga rhizophila]|uniref:Helix-turn-helix domain-containing protein n=1 Tax=Chitinophaga rhizophila TaxID=2866212 RepID=A0ABS7G6T4_9BACT|nr:helix-turn-helix transcriptional regulator [Chitinophaga rhizophila]MBW8683373.1 helix-turn-helix domain-containing protein [Chitinophaga rhizophila]